MDIAGDSIDRLMMVEIRHGGRNRGFKWRCTRPPRRVPRALVNAAAAVLDGRRAGWRS